MGRSPSVWQIKQSLGYLTYQEMMVNYPLYANIVLNKDNPVSIVCHLFLHLLEYQRAIG